MYFYRDKGLFLQRLHPATTFLYTGLMMILAVIYSNPLYLTAMLAVVIWTIIELDGRETLKWYSRIAGMMAVFVMIINPLLSREGQTILWHGPRVPVIGVLDISLEAALYGLNMALRLFLLIAVFAMYNLMMDPDRAMSSVSRIARKSAVVLALTVRLIPSMVSQARNVADIQRARGVNLDSGGIYQRWKKRIPFLKVMLLTSLENSWHTAEAMEARAFGSGPPTRYVTEVWRPRDTWITAAVLVSLLTAITGLLAGAGSFEFYPRLGDLTGSGEEILILIILTIMLAIPPALARGYKGWNFIERRI